MGSYDITSILNFKPATLLCKRCRGMIYGLETDWKSKTAGCPVCLAEYHTVWDESEHPNDSYRPTFSFNKANDYLRSQGCGIKFDDLIAHSRRLASLVVLSKGTPGSTYDPPWPTMRLFLAALSEAKAFIHFASYGISHQMLGGLKLSSMRVPVRGWASNVESNTRAEMEEWPTEAPNFKAKAINSKYWREDVPHQKLVIIDGLLAFTGTANLTNHGMRQVDRAFDIQSVITDLAEVRRLNNTYFSKVWAEIGAEEGVKGPLVVMDEEPF